MSEDHDTEIWRDVPGYEGLYQVSNLGRVKSVRRQRMNGIAGLCWMPERILRPGKNSDGYLNVALNRNDGGRSYAINRLVLLAFVGPPKDKEECLHSPDHDKTNNRLDNLRWGTHAENIQQWWHTKNSARKHDVNLRIREIREARRLSMEDVAKAVGVDFFHIEHGLVPKLATARRLADFFGKTVEELWPERAGKRGKR